MLSSDINPTFAVVHMLKEQDNFLCFFLQKQMQGMILPHTASVPQVPHQQEPVTIYNLLNGASLSETMQLSLRMQKLTRLKSLQSTIK